MGVNGHTVQFKPRRELYAKVCRKVHNYRASFTMGHGQRDRLYPPLPKPATASIGTMSTDRGRKPGFETDVCVMFNNTPHDSWKDMAKDAEAYGVAFANAFQAPRRPRSWSRRSRSATSPGSYADEKKQEYRTLFESMARGLAQGDPKLKVATCNITAGKSGPYEKSVTCVAGLNELYDVLSTHSYAMADGWPTWRRGPPEDPKIEFLKSIDALIAFTRSDNARGEAIWLTEFGWDT